MRKSLFSPSFFTLVFLGALYGCSGSTSSLVNIQNGALTGVVSLGSEWGSGPLNFSSSAGVTVALDSTTFSTMTDSAGFWRLNNVPAGNYDVTISKSGFGLFRVYGVTIEGPGTAFIPHIDLGEAPPVATKLEWVGVTDVPTRDTGYATIKELEVRWSIPLARTYSSLCIFLDKDSLEQPGDVHWYFNFDGHAPWDGLYSGGSSDSSGGLQGCPIEELHAAGIPSGSTVYVSVAQLDPYSINGQPPNNGEMYYDPIHNQHRLISPSPRSNVIAVVVP